MAKQHFGCTKRYQTLTKYLPPCSQLGKRMGASWKSLICSKAARWLSLLPLLRFRLHIHDDEVISNTQDPPALQAHISNPTPVHRLLIITGNDWSSQFTHKNQALPTQVGSTRSQGSPEMPKFSVKLVTVIVRQDNDNNLNVKTWYGEPHVLFITFKSYVSLIRLYSMRMSSHWTESLQATHAQN